MTDNDSTMRILTDRADLITHVLTEAVAGMDAVEARPFTVPAWQNVGLPPAIQARGWANLDVAVATDRDVALARYSPIIVASATSDLALAGNGSVPAYLDLVTLVWEAQLGELASGRIHADEDLDAVAVQALADLDIPEAIEFYAHINLRALDELLDVSHDPDDASWADAFGLRD